MSETVSDADAIAKANCRRCKATKGNPCVYTPPPRPEWIPEAEFLARSPTNADLRRRFERAGKPMKGVHQERRDAIWRSGPRGAYTIRVDRVEYEELLTEVERLRSDNAMLHAVVDAVSRAFECDGTTAGVTTRVAVRQMRDTVHALALP